MSDTQTEAPLSEAPFKVVVFADFVCPYSYLTVSQVDRLAKEYGVRPIWRPHWLHPDTPPEGTPRGPEESSARQQRLLAWIKDMSPEHLDRIRVPEKRQYSFLAVEALEYAAALGLDFEFKTALYELMWTAGQDIGEVDTLVNAAQMVGIPPEDMRFAIENRLYAQRALDAVNQARTLGIMNTPTLILGRTRINGWHYYEVLQEVVEKQGLTAVA
jgi:predicted DsbA family dithiol-disulfide isomerase